MAWPIIVAGVIAAAGAATKMKGFNAAGASSRLAGLKMGAQKRKEAGVLRQQADQTIIAGNREALDQKQQARLVASRAQALVAAGGGGTMDPTIVNLIGNIEGEGSYRAALSMYQAEEQARALRLEADTKVFEGQIAEEEGKAADRAARFASIGALFGGASQFMGAMGGGGK